MREVKLSCLFLVHNWTIMFKIVSFTTVPIVYTIIVLKMRNKIISIKYDR